MLFSTGIIVAALVAAAQALQFNFPPGPFAPVIGVPVELAWSDAVGPVTITVKNGPSGNLQDVEVILAGSSATTYTWTPQNLPSDTYALEITDGVNVNFSPQFTLVGDTTTGVTTTPDLTTTSVTSANTSTATTTTATTSSVTDTTTTTSASPTETTPGNDSQKLASSLALVIGAFAAFVVFN